MRSRCLCAASAVIIMLVFILLGCSGKGGGAVLPDVAGTDVEMTPTVQGADAERNASDKGRYLWGFWMMNLNADHTAIEPVPVRDAGFHLNVLGYLEPPGANKYLKIVSVSWSEYDTLLVDIQLIHPFLSNKMLTGRDVRGIAILPYNKIFPITTVRNVHGVPVPITASRRLVNADGYTTLWNRETAQAVQYPKIMGYIRGRYATPNEYFIEGNLHGFKNFYTDPMEHVFQCNQAATRQYEFDFPPGPLTFAYSVDCSWAPPINLPVTDIWADFAPSANCPEPYQISASIISNSLTKLGGSAVVQFDVMDWQDPTNFSHVHVEAPDLFYGTIEPTIPPVYPDPNTARYEVTVPNTKGSAVTAGGGSDLLVVVEDVENSTVTPDLTAYNIFKLPVADVPGFWRDRNGNGTFVNVPIVAPLIEPSSPSLVSPDLAVISYPQPDYDFYNGKPEIMLFDSEDARFVVYNRTLTSSFVKAGYPIQPFPPSWLLYPFCMDSNNMGWFGVGSNNTTSVVGTYQVQHLINMFRQSGIYGYSWHTGTAPAYLETIRDVTAGMGNVVGDPVYGLFAFKSGTVPTVAHALEVRYPYIDPSNANTFRTSIPMLNTGYIPGAINSNAERLKCGVDTDPAWQPPKPQRDAFYIVESNPSLGTSEVEGFDVAFNNTNTDVLWNLTNAQIQSEFPGAWAVDCEVVPSYTDHVTLQGDQTAEYNWLCVLMTDGIHYWLAFYDPLNPSPDNPGNNTHATIYTSNKVPCVGSGFTPVALDVDFQFFEVYTLSRDDLDVHYISVFEFFY